MSRLAIAAAGAAVLAFARPTSGSYTRQQLESMARAAALFRGASAVWFLAICDTENAEWNPQTVNMGRGDAGRGGAYGCPQLTLTTARYMDDRVRTHWRDVDPSRPGSTLLASPALCFDLAAAYLRSCRVSGEDAADSAARYNSGQPLRFAPESTRDVYVPRFRRNLAAREARA